MTRVKRSHKGRRMSEDEALQALVRSPLASPQFQEALDALRPQRGLAIDVLLREVVRAGQYLRNIERIPRPARALPNLNAPWSPLGEPDHLLASIEYLEMVGRIPPRLRYDRKRFMVTVTLPRSTHSTGLWYIAIAIPDDCFIHSPRWEEDLRVLSGGWVTRGALQAHPQVDLSIRGRGIPAGSYRLAVITTTTRPAGGRIMPLGRSRRPRTASREALIKDLLTLHPLPRHTVGARDVRVLASFIPPVPSTRTRRAKHRTG